MTTSVVANERRIAKLGYGWSKNQISYDILIDRSQRMENALAARQSRVMDILAPHLRLADERADLIQKFGSQYGVQDNQARREGYFMVVMQVTQLRRL